MGGGGAYLLLVLQPVAAALHVHLLGVGVVELAVAELAVEAERLAVVAADLLDVVEPHGLHLRLVVLGRVVGRVYGGDGSEAPARHERDCRRSGNGLFGYEQKSNFLSGLFFFMKYDGVFIGPFILSIYYEIYNIIFLFTLFLFFFKFLFASTEFNI